MGGCQVAHWVRTGEFVPKADGDKSSEAPTKTTEDKFDFAYNYGVEEVGSDLSSLPGELIGVEGDPLIPTVAAIDRVVREARATWQHFVREAEALPPCSFPRYLNDPYILLQDVPPLPGRLPSAGLLVGQPIWRVSGPGREQAATQGPGPTEDSAFDLHTVSGRREDLVLWYKDAIACRTAAALPSDAQQQQAVRSRGHLILTLGWAYILSVRLLEIQRRPVVYTEDALQPQSATDAARLRRQGRLVLNLTGAGVSAQLVRWLCALLSPQLGWRAKDARMVPPWASRCAAGDVVFAVAANANVQETAPPTSGSASTLLAEFCALYNLDAVDAPNDTVTISPITAAFMAALTLPLYRLYDLQPQFPVPRLRRRKLCKDVGPFTCIKRYVTDLNYFMTLSISPRSVASIVWSVFWQPDIDANLVSPWLAGTLHALRPTLASCDVVKLVQIFAMRRPRVPLWWLGICLLGNQRILAWVTRYLETLEEQEGYGSLATPDITAFAWTGIQHAFSHAPPPHPYKDPSQPVARADLLWHRLNFSLQDAFSIPLAWCPFGHVRKECIELDIWPWLEHGCQRRYVTWVWWIKEKGKAIRSEERGFQADTGRAVQNVPDVLSTRRSTGPKTRTSTVAASENPNPIIKLEPSMEATLRMVSFCMADMRGEQDMSLAVLNGIRSHKWLRGWGGFD
ncbi:hypothetical protein SPI_07128 [Niveomyces insectorum RCEF 264]|uniref:Uncharacterized protein n=1 Tax=Niveomyces insectorum RCEF 264 TaxID=1081102 RepID=A0A167QAY6_9HYPO|nr:hypothetical protein SPI_07128 [Niveomyces insectorum RCEF 264]